MRVEILRPKYKWVDLDFITDKENYCMLYVNAHSRYKVIILTLYCDIHQILKVHQIIYSAKTTYIDRLYTHEHLSVQSI